MPNFRETRLAEVPSSELCETPVETPVLYDRTSYVQCRECRVVYIRGNQGCFRGRRYGGYHLREDRYYMGRSSMGAYKKLADEPPGHAEPLRELRDAPALLASGLVHRLSQHEPTIELAEPAFRAKFQEFTFHALG